MKSTLSFVQISLVFCVVLIHASMNGELQSKIGGSSKVNEWKNAANPSVGVTELPPGAVARLGIQKLRYPAKVTAIAIDPLEKFIVSGHVDRDRFPFSNDLIIWEKASGELANSYGVSGGYISQIKISRDRGKIFVLAGNQLRAWNRKSGKGLLLYRVGPDARDIRLAPDEKHLAIIVGQRIDYIEFNQSKITRSFKGISFARKIAISANGKYIAAGSLNGRLGVWEIESGKSLHHYQLGSAFVTGVALSPDGKFLAASAGNSLFLWNNATGKPMHKCVGHRSDILSFDFSPNGTYLASSSRDATIRLWDVTTGKIKFLMKNHLSPINCVVFGAKGKMLYSGSADQLVQIWSVGSGKPLIKKEEAHHARVESMALDETSSKIYTGGNDGTIRVWKIPNGNQQEVIARETTGIGCLAISSDKRALAWINWGTDEPLVVRDLKSNTIIWKGGKFSLANNIAFTPNGKKIFLSASGEVWECDVKHKKFVRFGGGLSYLAISPDGKRLATGRGRNEICIWEIESQKLVGVCTGHILGVRELQFAPNGSLLASAGVDGTVRLWDMKSFKSKQVLDGHKGSVESLSFSPNSKLLVSGGVDREIIAWDIATGKVVRRFHGHRGTIHALAFLRDGTRFVSVSGDHTGLIWNLAAKSP